MAQRARQVLGVATSALNRLAAATALDRLEAPTAARRMQPPQHQDRIVRDICRRVVGVGRPPVDLGEQRPPTELK